MNKCKHDGCKCSDVQADGYCSDACRQEKNSGGSCGCGHRNCK